ncbi:MAG: hypothetical protein DWQ34_23945 [Planctomycetota bacterium]|nr:MAG: hypothetical protein DWQ29_17875 [Planctomycetota bacterium]REJ87705.1 MAG: hypothetical protein DWQ34_23945 [Planctomycetota bacterium]REK27789.1 MAG: hypothetical protein DWQ41_06695 [Planctomycetota bacterium]REK34414.1 MAG: hypothetical protein DWQ45_13250 [Planctomycetota bacterium]
MPMQLNIGFSEKKGQPDFGSIGASVNLQLELEGSLVNDPSRLRDSIRRLFGEARNAVEEELARDGTNGHAENPAARNGSQRPATAAQVKAIHAISRRQRIDLPALLGDRFGCSQPDELTLQDASKLIDNLNGASQNVGVRR